MARRHPIAVAIKQQAGKEARLTMSCACVPLGGVAGKLCLNRIPQRLIDDRRVLTRMGLLLVDDLASIDPVLQHQVERAAGEWLAAPQATRCAGPQLALDAAGVELVLQQPNRAEFGIATKNEAHGFRLAFDDDELAVLCPMTSRSNCAKDNRTLRVKRPIEVVVLNCCVTETKEAPLVSRISTILAKSASERVSRSIL